MLWNYLVNLAKFSIELVMALCQCVCPSVCHRSCTIERDGWIDLGFGIEASFDQSHTVLQGNSAIYKNKGTSLWNFVINPGLENFTVTCQSLKCVISLAEKGECSEHDKLNHRWSAWQYLQALTLDCCSLSQFCSVYSMIPLRVSSNSWYLCDNISCSYNCILFGSSCTSQIGNYLLRSCTLFGTVGHAHM